MRPEEASIKSLPSTVEDAYEKFLSRVGEEQRGNVKKILQIVVGARRPLTVQEMALALGVATSTQSKSLGRAKLDPIRLEERICQVWIIHLYQSCQNTPTVNWTTSTGTMAANPYYS